MAAFNRILNVLILVMAALAVAVGVKLMARREELRKRGDILAVTISEAAEELDVNSPTKIHEDLKTNAEDGSGELGYKAFHQEYLADQLNPWHDRLENFTEQAKSVTDQRDSLSQYLEGVANTFHLGTLTAKDMRDPKVAEEKWEELLALLMSYEERDSTMRKLLAQLNNDRLELAPLSPDDLKKQYENCFGSVDKAVDHLQIMNNRYSMTLEQAVEKMQGEYMSVTKAQIKQAEAAHRERFLKEIEQIMATVRTVDQMREQVATVTRKLEDTERTLDEVQEEKAHMAVAIDQLNTKVGNLETEVANAKERVRQLQGTGDQVRVEKDFDGKVLRVNYDYNFVIVDLGGRDKLPMGAQLTVARDREFICKVRVTELYRDYCVAEILPDQVGQVLAGDRVVTLR